MGAAERGGPDPGGDDGTGDGSADAGRAVVRGREPGFVAGPDGDVGKNLSWIYEHWEDIVSDLSVFHRIDDVAALAITRFLMLAVRLSAYSGALRARFAQQAASDAGTASLASVPVTASSTPGGGDGDTPDEVIRQIKL